MTKEEFSVKYTVLWIDDEPLDSIIKEMMQVGIKLIPKKSYNSGIEWLQNSEHRDICDAVILDVNCKKDDNEKDHNSDSFRDKAEEVYGLCRKDESKGHFIFWFILTAGKGENGAYPEGKLEDMIPKKEWMDQQYFLKGGDGSGLNKLAENIDKQCSKGKRYTLRQKYKGVFNICDDDDESKLLTIIDTIEKEEWQNTRILNVMRKLLPTVITYGKEHGLFPDYIYSLKNARNCLNTIYRANPELVPCYIATNFHSIEDTINNGSHGDKENSNEKKNLVVDPDITSSKAYFLNRVVFFQLCTIFKWFWCLPQKESKIQELKTQVDTILKDNPINDIEGEVKVCDGKYYINSKDKVLFIGPARKKPDLAVRDKISVLKYIKNEYPFNTPEGTAEYFAKSYEKIE